MQEAADTTAEVCTTQKAAQLLGISVTSVQQLVESGAIEAWKTKGGHRRIPVDVVRAYKASMGGLREPGVNAVARNATIVVIEDNEIQRGIYQNQISSWGLPANFIFCENGYRALLEIASSKPDVVLTDIMMEGIDGYEVIKTILNYPAFSNINIAIISMLTPEDLEARGGIPKGVVFFEKPVNYDELRGYLRACCAQHAARNRS